MNILTSVWGIQLIGHDEDVENLKNKVNGSIRRLDDFFVSKLDDCIVLRTSRWDTASDFDEARLVAQEDLNLLVSCMYTLDQTLSLSIGTIFRFHSDDRIDQQRESAAGYIRIRESEYASPESFKNLVDAARQSLPLRIAASEVTAESGWFEVFKALEGLKRYYGNESKLVKAFPQRKSSIELMKRTANSYRHAAGSYDPIKNPMKLHDAKHLIRTILTETLSNAKADRVHDAAGFGVPDITSAEGQPKFGLNPVILGLTNGTAHVGDVLHGSDNGH